MSNVDIEELLKQRKREDSKKPSETLAAKIDQFISGTMRANEMDVFSKTHGPQIDAEITRRGKEKARKAESARNEVEEYATKIWRGQQSAENCYSEQRQFMRDFPQFVGCLENIDAIASELRSQNLVPHYQNLVQVFGELIHRGDLLLSPAAIGAGAEETVTGEDLRRHPNLKLLLQPAEERERSRVARQSADEYKSEHIEDWPQQGIPPLILHRIGKVLDTFSASHPEYLRSETNKSKIVAALTKSGLQITTQSLEEIFKDLTARGELDLDSSAIAEHGSTRLIDLGGRDYPGFPSESEKYSFKMKIRSMSAEEIKQRCLDDPQFKDSLDSL